MALDKFTREELLLAGVALLLAIDLLFLPWFDISVGFGGLTLSVTSTATGSPDGWLGILGVLASLALLADLALERLSAAQLPTVGGNRATTRVALAVVAAACVAVKFILNVHFDWFGAGFWGAAGLSVALVVLATRIRDA
ncbi:MAG TPA: hypothetical protein VIH85_11775 [Solirubrobacteraceae bacterium]